MAIEIVNAEPLRRNLDVIYPRHRALSRDAQSFLAVAAGGCGDGGSGERKRRNHGGGKNCRAIREDNRVQSGRSASSVSA